MIRDLVLKNRSYRRFKQSEAIALETLKELVDLGRLSASGGNMQPLKYMLSCDPAGNARIFPHLRWAGYLKDWDGPEEGERPAGYVVILGDTEVKSGVGCDHGISAQSILLGAVEKGLGGCMIGSIDRDGLRKTLQLSPRYEIALVLALGTPNEAVRLEEAGPEGDIKYWRDTDGVHHVPKRPLDDIVLAPGS